ncbi:hypothetical protein TNCV_2777371 [Trichonephila clavipes]|nr:hypothetical protein TNCV_2777371 [Trichonephila clavipes]
MATLLYLDTTFMDIAAAAFRKECGKKGKGFITEKTSELPIFSNPNDIFPNQLPSYKRIFMCFFQERNDHGLVAGVFETSTTEDLPCRGARCSSNQSRFKRPTTGVVWKLGEGMRELQGPSSKALEQLKSAT